MNTQPAHAVRVETRLLAAEENLPNNPELPLLVYRQALRDVGPARAAEVERLFRTNDWGGAWRNGVFGYDPPVGFGSETFRVMCGG